MYIELDYNLRQCKLSHLAFNPTRLIFRITQLQFLTQISTKCNGTMNWGWTSGIVLTDCTQT